jgi:hypothetical protein
MRYRVFHYFDSTRLPEDAVHDGKHPLLEQSQELSTLVAGFVSYANLTGVVKALLQGPARS